MTSSIRRRLSRFVNKRVKIQHTGDKIKGDDEHSGSVCYVRNVPYVPTASYQINEEIPTVCYVIGSIQRQDLRQYDSREPSPLA